MLVLLVSINAKADFKKFAQRCAEDSLDPSQAIQRNNWAIRCSKLNGGKFYGMSINQFISLMYDVDFVTMSRTPKAKPEYPLFANKELTQTWKAPIDENAACEVPSGYDIVGQCTSSCYTGDQMILFADGYIPIEEAYNHKLQEIAVVDSVSTMGDIYLRTEGVSIYTRSASKKAINTILVFRTKYGPELSVTQNHPLLNKEGKIVQADQFKIGDSLVGIDGKEQEITDIQSKQFTGYVYNVQPELVEGEFGSVDIAGQLVVAQTYLAGSSFLQNEGIKYLNNFTLRKNIPADLL